MIITTKNEYTVKEGVVVTFQCNKWWTNAVTIYLNGTAVATWAGSRDYSSKYIWTAKKDAKINCAGYNQQSANIYLSETIDISGVTLAPEELTMNMNDIETLTATVSPDNASDKTVIWSTDNASVASVDYGVVTATGIGTATITATATNGTDSTSDDKTATCTVTVKALTYTISIPDSVAIESSGWNPFSGISASSDSLSSTKTLKVTASSAKGWLFSSDTTPDTVSYDLKVSADAAEKNADVVWSFSADELKNGGTTKSMCVVVIEQGREHIKIPRPAFFVANNDTICR